MKPVTVQNPFIDALREKAASIRCVTTKAAVNAVADAFETVYLAERESVDADGEETASE